VNALLTQFPLIVGAEGQLVVGSAGRAGDYRPSNEKQFSPR